MAKNFYKEFYFARSVLLNFNAIQAMNTPIPYQFSASNCFSSSSFNFNIYIPQYQGPSIPEFSVLGIESLHSTKTLKGVQH